MSASCDAIKGNLDGAVLSYHKDPIRQAVLGKIARRLIPFLFILHLVAFLDRANLPYAQLQMGEALSFSYTTYGIGAGIFFTGYFLFGVPSSMFLKRVGPRRGIACITVTWGIITMGLAFINSPLSFYAMRFLLGIAEAGFFPGVIFYLMYWLPAAERARYFSCFIVAIPIAGISGALMAGIILSRDAFAGIAGWQWIFLVEGFLAVVLGVVAIFYLADSPDKATWLSRDEKWWIEKALRADERKENISTTLRDGLLGAKVITLGTIYATFIFAGTGFILWSAADAQGVLPPRRFHHQLYRRFYLRGLGSGHGDNRHSLRSHRRKVLARGAASFGRGHRYNDGSGPSKNAHDLHSIVDRLSRHGRTLWTILGHSHQVPQGQRRCFRPCFDKCLRKRLSLPRTSCHRLVQGPDRRILVQPGRDGYSSLFGRSPYDYYQELL